MHVEPSCDRAVDLERDVDDREPRRQAGRPRPRSRGVRRRATPFASALRSRRLDRLRVEVDGADRPEAELRGRDREHARAAADVEQAAARQIEQQLEAEARRRVAPVPNARPGSITTAIASASGSSHGGPTQSGPIRTGRWNARQRSSQPSSTSSERVPPNAAHSRSSPAGSVYAASSTPPSWSTSSKPSGKSSIMIARARSACAVGHRDGDAASGSAEGALQLVEETPRRRPACTSPRRPSARTARAAGAARRSGAAGRRR